MTLMAELGVATRRQVRRRAHALAGAVRPPAALGRYLSTHPDDAGLHLGCGGAILDDWLNTDRDPAPGAAHLDVTRPFPLPSGSFDRVLCEHVIEHIPLTAGRRMLSECARVLRSGGRIRVSTPDLERLAGLCAGVVDAGGERYAAWSAASFVPDGVGSPAALTLNNTMRAWGHCFLYDEATLARALRDVGFQRVERHAYGASDDPAFHAVEGHGIDAIGIEMRTWETLALEATR